MPAAFLRFRLATDTFALASGSRHLGPQRTSTSWLHDMPGPQTEKGESLTRLLSMLCRLQTLLDARDSFLGLYRATVRVTHSLDCPACPLSLRLTSCHQQRLQMSILPVAPRRCITREPQTGHPVVDIFSPPVTGTTRSQAQSDQGLTVALETGLAARAPQSPERPIRLSPSSYSRSTSG